MKIRSFPSISPHRNPRFASNTNFNYINGSQKEKSLYFLDMKIKIPLKNKVVLEKLTSKSKFLSESSQNLRNNLDNILPNINEKKLFEDENDFETWKNKQLAKMSGEMKNAVKNNEKWLHQKAKQKKNFHRDDKHFLSTQFQFSEKNIKTPTGEYLFSENDEVFNYFSDLDSIIKNAKAKSNSIFF